jgi:transcriptional regulator GlxA family with amidase domain
VKRAYFLVLPQLHLLDLAGPLQILATLKELALADVDVECIGPRRDLQTFQRAILSEVRPLPASLPPGSVLFVAGSKLDRVVTTSQWWRDAAAWLKRQAHVIGTELQVCGVCTGTFLLAEAGLLDGKLCTTHHRFLRHLENQAPTAHVTDNRVFVRDGNIWTSAGVASGIDLALHLVAESFGDHAAVQVARENVVHFRRFGGDPVIAGQLRYRSHGNSLVHSAQDAISLNLALPMPQEELARTLGCSSRHLARVFVQETGITIKRYQTELRMQLAHQLLAGSKLSLEEIAERCGYGSVQAFRANWNQREKRRPSAVRVRPT